MQDSLFYMTAFYRKQMEDSMLAFYLCYNYCNKEVMLSLYFGGKKHDEA